MDPDHPQLTDDGGAIPIHRPLQVCSGSRFIPTSGSFVSQVFFIKQTLRLFQAAAVIRSFRSAVDYCVFLQVTTQTSLIYYRGRNNSKFSGCQQDYLVGKSGSPQIYLVFIWPRFKQNNMTHTKLEKYS